MYRVGAKYSIFIKALKAAAATRCGRQASRAEATGAGRKDLITYVSSLFTRPVVDDVGRQT